MTAVLTDRLEGITVNLTTDAPPLSVEWVLVDPDTARTYLDENDANRALRARVVNAYARDMGHGAWAVTGETIKFSKTGELLDGQHRLSAIIESGTSQWMLVVRGLEPATKGIIDTGAPRSAGDALKLVGLDAGNPYAVAAAARLLVLWRTDRLRTMSSGLRHEDRATHGEIIEMVRKEPDILDAVSDAYRDYERTGLPTGPAAMARVVLHGIDAKDAALFFESLAGYATEGSTDPRAVLLYTVRQMRALGQMRKPGEAIGLIFSAWNAWRDKQKIKTLPTKDNKGRALPIPTPI